MKSRFLVFALFLCCTLAKAQDNGRTLLRGKVLYRDSNVINENVINSTAELATITDENGEFVIAVKLGDQLVFTAVNYKLKVVKITEEILKKNRLVIEVKEKVTELDEVVVGPENQEKFIQLQNEELRENNYEIDRSTEVENIALSQSERGLQNGLNFVNIFKAIFKSKDKGKEENKPKLKVSEVLRQVYDDEFFVLDLKLPQENIDDFLRYCDERVPEKTLLKKENEFQLLDFLVTHSKAYLKELKTRN